MKSYASASIAVLVAFTTPDRAMVAEPESGLAILQKSVDYRKQIKSYSFSARVDCRYKAATEKEPRRFTGRITVWSDGTRLRVDSVAEVSSANPRTQNKRHIECKNCERPAHTLIYTNGDTLVNFHPADLKGALFILDYPAIGYRHTQLWSHADGGLGEDVLSPHYRDHKVEPTATDGVEALQVTSVHARAGTTRIVRVRPDMRFSVDRIESVLRVPGRENATRYSTVSTLSADPVTGYWFPRRWVHTERGADGYESEETVDLEAVKINQPVPAPVFGLSGLDLPDGVVVGFPELKNKKTKIYPTWRQGKLDYGFTSEDVVRAQQATTPVAPSIPTDPAADFRGLGPLAMGLTFLTAAAILIYLRRSKRQA